MNKEVFTLDVSLLNDLRETLICMCLLQLKGEIKEVFTLEVGFMHLTKGPGK